MWLCRADCHPVRRESGLRSRSSAPLHAARVHGSDRHGCHASQPWWLLKARRRNKGRIAVSYPHLDSVKRERGTPALEACLRTNLTLQLDLDNLERFLAGIFRQVSEGIHVLHRPSFCLDVLTLSIRVGELGVSVR